MILIEILIGVLLGFVIGLIPSMHINTISYFFIFIGGYELLYNNSYFFISLAVSQLITSYISISAFGVPNDSTIMHLFPLQRLSKEGKLKKGVYLCLVGSFFGGVFSLLLFPVLYLLFSTLFDFNLFIYGLIILILIMFVILEKTFKKRFAIISIILLSGVLGIFTLKYNYYISEPLMICVVGLFAFPFILESIFSKTKFIKQKDCDVELNFKETSISSFLGTVGSLFMILIPSFSSSQASLLISKIKKQIDTDEYLIIFSSVAISALFFSFFLAINFYKPRLGYIAILLSNNIIGNSVSNFSLGLTLFLSLCLSILLVSMFYKKIIDFISRLNLRLINISLIVFIFILIIMLFGIKAVPLLILSTLIGFLPLVFGVDRVILMSYIMIPTILFYIWFSCSEIKHPTNYPGF